MFVITENTWLPIVRTPIVTPSVRRVDKNKNLSRVLITSYYASYKFSKVKQSIFLSNDTDDSSFHCKLFTNFEPFPQNENTLS